MKLFKSFSFMRSSTLIALVAFYFTVILNYPFYNKVLSLHPFTGAPEDYFLLTMPLFVFFVLNAAFQLLALPILHKVIIPLLIVISAAIGYNALFFDVYFTTDMLENVLQTTPAESMRMMTWQFITWMIVLGVLPAMLYLFVKINYRVIWKELLTRISLIVLSGVVVFGISRFYYQDYAAFVRNNKSTVALLVPSNFIAAGVNKIKLIRKANIPYQQIGLDIKQAKQDNYRNLMIIVVGEATRAQNWGLNGYSRQTTPKLAARGDEVINFKQVESCGTSTAVSVPCMFSVFTQKQYDSVKAEKTDNLLDILQRANSEVLWVDNNSDCKGVCLRVPNRTVKVENFPQLCIDGECLDETLLKDFEKEIDSTNKDMVLVLHTIGNHGPTYYERYSPEFKQFIPTCDTNEIQKCSNEQLINAYDNGVLYIDNFLDTLIAKVEHRKDLKTAIFYISDHGESLGENGVYLHGTPRAIAPTQQTHIPMIFWFSDTWKKNKPFDLACVKQKAETERFSQDNLFHTVLSMMDIDLTLSVYDKDLDILSSCRTK
ncbi:phosphoethanolamine transferase [Actinobacillus seminis]|uniref:Phosphoethanolamine transferase n=2 Tax=Actinobacillus seminis TaxID=722 RepID=A0ABX4FLJ6_9PAST|nr:phosphoethanolamine--lipid A transferase [Actinobacillus seminis]OZN24707.1 phosphoethanolamine transferase [Actinobacillus seminis]